MPATFLLLLNVTLPAKPLPLPGSVAEVIAYGVPAVKLKPLHLLAEDAWDMHPGLFMVAVAVALLIVLVMGDVEKFTVGVTPVV